MTVKRFWVLSMALISFVVCSESNRQVSSGECSVQLNAVNSMSQNRLNAIINVPLSTLLCSSVQGKNLGFIAEVDGENVASQLVDTNFDGKADSMLLALDFAGNQTRHIKITSLLGGVLKTNYPIRTQAEMAVRVGGRANASGVFADGKYQQVSAMTLPEDHIIGNKRFKYEGFGWESERIAYRFYFDNRGLIDIFGKMTTDLVLQQVGHDNSDYHSLADWGMDILKVGPSLGLGGVAAWRNSKVSAPKSLVEQSVKLLNGSLRSTALLSQKGWSLGANSYNMHRSFSIDAGSHLTHALVTTEHFQDDWAIGIVKHGVEKLEHVDTKSEWNYIATFGQQSEAGDELGMVVFFRSCDLQFVTDDEFNVLVILNPTTQLEYYFGAIWSAEPSGAKTLADFKKQIEAYRLELNQPIKITIQ